MMLQALVAYAERDELGDADFEPVGVRWLIALSANGSMAGDPIPLQENSSDKKPRPKTMTRPFTSTNELNQGTKSHFLCDSLERAVLFLDPKSPEKAGARKTQHAYFLALLEEAARAIPAEAAVLGAVRGFLSDSTALRALHARLLELKAKCTENVTFQVDGKILLENALIKQFWRERRKRPSAGASVRHPRVCCATGQLGETLDTTEKIKGVPGGLAMGTNLISFDKDAFCSFGLEQAQNAPVSAAAELKIRASLNRLIEKSRSQGLVFGDTIHLHWSRMPIANDPTDLLASADAEAVESLINSVQSGRRYLGLDTNAYYAVSLSGNGGRIVVREWMESSVPEVEQSIARWFGDLALVRPEGTGVRRDFKLSLLLRSMIRKKLDEQPPQLDELPPQIPTRLFHSALYGPRIPLPQSVLAAAVRRQQLEAGDKLNPARIALIKACLLRLPSSLQNQPSTIPTMTESLSFEFRDAAYLCGRLFAVFDRLQYLALRDVNAGVVERYYASACVTPGLVMGRLFKNAQFHLAKAGGGLAENIRKDFEEIASLLGHDFPTTLSLEGQGRFALGFYHQKAEYRRRTAERKDLATCQPAQD